MSHSRPPVGATGQTTCSATGTLAGPGTCVCVDGYGASTDTVKLSRSASLTLSLDPLHTRSGAARLEQRWLGRAAGSAETFSGSDGEKGADGDAPPPPQPEPRGGEGPPSSTPAAVREVDGPATDAEP